MIPRDFLCRAWPDKPDDEATTLKNSDRFFAEPVGRLRYSRYAMPREKFADILVRAATARGSLLAVAKALEVDPRQVYDWIAGGNGPAEDLRRELEARLEKLAPY